MSRGLKIFKKFVGLTLLFAMVSQTVFAATYIVDTDGEVVGGICGDMGVGNWNCTLPSALSTSNSSGVPNNIFVETNQTLSLTMQSLNVTRTVDVDGNGALDDKTNVIDGDPGWSVFNVSGADAVDTHIHDFAGINGGYTGVSVDSASGVNITNNVIADNVEMGISANTANGLVVAGNVIGGNGDDGVQVVWATGVYIDRNKIGTTADGLSADANGARGIDIENVGAIAITNNVISGNVGPGVYDAGGISNLSITGNIVGLNATGTAVIPNGGYGLCLNAPIFGVTLQIGDLNGDPNIISGNTLDGITIGNIGDTNGPVIIQNNYVGVGINGNEVGLGNDGVGIAVYGPTEMMSQLIIGSNLDGVNDEAEGNVVSGNNVGIMVQPEIIDDLKIGYNKVGTDKDGNIVEGLGNDGFGISTVSNGAITISNNKSAQNGGDGISVSGAPGVMGSVLPEISVTNNVLVGNLYSGFGVGTLYSHDTPVYFYGNLVGIDDDEMTVIGMGNGYGGVGIGDGIAYIGGPNNLYDAVVPGAGDLGYGNVFNNADFVSSVLAFNGEARAAYVYGNIFGLTSNPETGVYDQNAGSQNIYAYSPVMTDLVIGGTNINGNYYDDPSQLRNVISGRRLFEENYSLEYITLSMMCDREAGLLDPTYCDNAEHEGNITIQNNYIGTDFTGMIVPGDDLEVLGLNGIGLEDGDNITIGGINANEGNLISYGHLDMENNSGTSLSIDDESDFGGEVTVQGNIIGLNVLGTESLDSGNGIGYSSKTGSIVIGGIEAAAKNIIAGLFSGGEGIRIDSSVTGVSRILGNYIGVGINGNETDLGNNYYGLELQGGTIYLGEAADGTITKNVISGNTGGGVIVMTEGDAHIEIKGAYIGTDVTGHFAIPNGSTDGFFPGGIAILDGAGSEIIIGGDKALDGSLLEGNLISGNYGAGILSWGSHGLQILGNYIGVDAIGTAALPNVAGGMDPLNFSGEGIALMDVGLDMPVEEGGPVVMNQEHVLISENVIAGNEGSGIAAQHMVGGEVVNLGGADYTTLEGGGFDWSEGGIMNNFIGTSFDGTISIPNGTANGDRYGIYFNDETNDGEYVVHNLDGWRLDGGFGDLEGSDPGPFSGNTINGGAYFAYSGESNTADQMNVVMDEIYTGLGNTWSGVFGDGLVNGLYQLMVYVTTEGDPEADVPDYCRPAAACQEEEDDGGGILIVTQPPRIVQPEVIPEVIPEIIPEVIPEVIPPNEQEVTDAIGTVGDEAIDLFVGTETGVENETTAEVTDETPLPPPTNISEVDTDAVYSSPTYASEALSLIINDKAECSGDKANECLKRMYGLDKDQENQTEAILEKELGDAVVFNKKPGEIITIPRIVNLSGTVGSSPAILALSKPNEVVTIELVSEDPTTKEQSKLINTITGETDDEGKAVLNAMLVDGEYSATIYTMRSGNKITGKTVKFKVSQEVDQEFSIEGLTITEEYAHEPYVGEAGEFVKFLLSYTEKLEPIFIAKDYIEFSRTGGMVYVVQGRVDTLDNENKMVYLAYQSVTFGSAVISDASQKGAFRMVIPKGIGAGAHKLTAYAYNPKQVKATSQKQVLFQIKK